MIPPNVRGTPPVYQTPGLRVWYAPANTRRDLRKGSKLMSMQEFLLSERLQQVVDDATDDVAGEARGMAIEEGAVETGGYASGFRAERGPVQVIAGNARRTGRVVNEDPAAAPQEFGNRRVPARHVLLRAGLKFHTPRGIA